MSDRIVSTDGKYEGVLQGDGNFVVYRAADGTPVAALGADPDPIKPNPEPKVDLPDDEHEHMFSPTPLPPETNGLRTAHGQRFGVAVTFVVILLLIFLLRNET